MITSIFGVGTAQAESVQSTIPVLGDYSFNSLILVIDETLTQILPLLFENNTFFTDTKIRNIGVESNTFPSELRLHLGQRINLVKSPTFISNSISNNVTISENEFKITVLDENPISIILVQSNTNATSNSDWDGTIIFGSSNVDPTPTPNAFTIHTKTASYRFGSTETILFDNPIKLILLGKGTSENIVFFNSGDGNQSVDILACTFNSKFEPTISDLDDDELCYLKDGGDVIIWTSHFSHFGTYTSAQSVSLTSSTPSSPTSNSGTSNSGSSRSGGGGSIFSNSESRSDVLQESYLLYLERFLGYTEPSLETQILLALFGIRADTMPEWNKNAIQWVLDGTLDLGDLEESLRWQYKNNIIGS